jgi:hypothetical protein
MYFFISGQWEFTPKEKAEGPQVPREINEPLERAYQELVLTSEMVKQVNDVTTWSGDHKKMMFVGSLIMAAKLSEFVYDVESFHPPVRSIEDHLQALLDPSGPATNTRGSTPLKGKDKVPVAVQNKPKIVDKARLK